MQERKIKTGKKVRNVIAINSKENEEFKRLIEQEELFEMDFPSYVQGFVKGRSIVTNAQYHIGFPLTLTCDFKDFFEQVSLKKFSNLEKEGISLSKTIKEKCFIDDIARQGLPTSPFLANIAALPLDKYILESLEIYYSNNSKNFCYTRYADNIFISFRRYEDLTYIMDLIKKASCLFEFPLNPKKTRLLTAKAGRRIICGISVGEREIRTPRKFRRRLRSAEHHHWSRHILGYREFSKLKPPRVLTPDENNFEKELDKTRFNLFYFHQYRRSEIYVELFNYCFETLQFLIMVTKKHFLHNCKTRNVYRLEKLLDHPFFKNPSVMQRKTYVRTLTLCYDYLVVKINSRFPDKEIMKSLYWGDVNDVYSFRNRRIVPPILIAKRIYLRILLKPTNYWMIRDLYESPVAMKILRDRIIKESCHHLSLSSEEILSNTSEASFLGSFLEKDQADYNEIQEKLDYYISEILSAPIIDLHPDYFVALDSPYNFSLGPRSARIYRELVRQNLPLNDPLNEIETHLLLELLTPYVKTENNMKILL